MRTGDFPNEVKSGTDPFRLSGVSGAAVVAGLCREGGGSSRWPLCRSEEMFLLEYTCRSLAEAKVDLRTNPDPVLTEVSLEPVEVSVCCC